MSPEPATTSKPRRRTVVFTVLGSLLALVLLIIMFSGLDVTLNTIIALIRDVPLWGYATVILLTMMIFALSAYQWMLALQATQVNDDTPDYLALLAYTALGAMLGKIIPIQFSTPLVRSVMLRWRNQTSVLRSSTTSILEQGMALFVPVILSVPGILALENIITARVWGTAVVVMLVAGWLFFTYLVPPLLRSLVRFYDRIGEAHILHRFSFVRRLLDRFNALLDTPVLQPQTLQPLYAIAIVRYAVLMMRIMLIIWMLQLPVPLIFAFYVVPAIQVTQLVNLTPGNLGLREWTWVGLLVLAGVDATTTATFALAQRVLIFVAVLIATSLLVLLFGLVNLRDKRVQGANERE